MDELKSHTETREVFEGIQVKGLDVWMSESRVIEAPTHIYVLFFFSSSPVPRLAVF